MTSDRTPWSRLTPWSGRTVAPLRTFLRTESGSAGVLLAAIVAALVWANISTSSYETVWNTNFSIRLGDHALTRDLREWINSGLMTLFFLVVGLEARREVDLGDLRERRRFVLPVAAGMAGMLVPVLIFLAINAGGPGRHGWGVAMSTDTALALGALSLLGSRVPDRVRVFLLTVFVVDDLIALLVIAFVYSSNIKALPICIAITAFVVLIVVMRSGVSRPLIYVVLGVTMWGALMTSGVDPVVAGLAIGLTATAYSPGRESLEQATGLVRLFREQPTPELARNATNSLTSALSPNARLQRFYHPWTSFAIVPLFGLANAGIHIDASFVSHAYRSPVTIGIIVGYVVGKPIAVVGTSWLLEKATGRRVRPTVGWASVAGSGTIAGIGFTVSLLIATLAFSGADLAKAKLGVLTAGVLATIITWAVFRLTFRLSPARRALALLGDSDQLLDLIDPVDPERDHIRGSADATVTVVEYGDFQCPYCGMAEAAVREELSTDHDVRYVWRHLPLVDVHPDAQLAAEASEAAASQGEDAFWAMHDVMLTHQNDLQPMDLMRYAEELGLDGDRFHTEVKHHVHEARVAQDVQSADLSGVSGTPTFFVNGQRHYGAYDVAGLTQAIKLARARVLIDRRL